MINKDLLEYIRVNHNAGKSFEEIQNSLLSNGWTMSDILEGYRATGITPKTPQATVAPTPVTPSPAMPAEPVIASTPLSAPATSAQALPKEPVITMDPKPASTPAPTLETSPTAMPVVEHIVASPSPVNPAPVSRPSEPVITMSETPVANFPGQFPHDPLATHPTIAEPKKKHHWVLWTIIVLILLLGGAAAYAYTAGYFMPLATLGTRAYSSVQEATSVSFDMTISVDMSDLKSPSMSALIGAGSTPEKGSITMVGNFDASTPGKEALETTVDLRVGSFSANVDIKSIDKTFYAKLNSVSMAMLSEMVEPYKNRWFSFKMDDTENPAGSLPFMSMLGVDPSALKALTDAEKDHLISLANNAHFMIVKEKLAPEEINGVGTYHFSFDLDRDGIKNYLKDVDSYLKEIGTNNSYISSLDTSSVDKVLADTQSFAGEMWVGRKDHLLYKMKVDVVQKAEGEEGTIKLTLVSIFKDWNVPKTITAPTDSTSFKDLINESMGAAREKGADAQNKSILSSVRAQAEIYADSKSPNYSYVGMCSSPGVSSLVGSIPVSAKFTCKESVGNYTAYIQLSTGNYFCIDSNGNANEIAAVPTGYVCPTN